MDAAIVRRERNARLTGAGSRRLEGTNSGHKNAEGRAGENLLTMPDADVRDVCNSFPL
jgi:hypothetical protein